MNSNSVIRKSQSISIFILHSGTVKKPIYLILFLTLSIPSIVLGQVNYSHSPSEGAFIPRNPVTNKALYDLKGEVTDNSYNSLKVSIFKSGKFQKSYTLSLKFSGNTAPFKVPLQLDAGKHFYKLIYEFTGGKTHADTVDGILVGDVYLIQGQSNAVAASYQTFNTAYNDTFLRSFGTSSTNGNAVLPDTHWYPMTGSAWYNKGSVGQWGAVMAKTLLDSFGIPICILNGAVGGTRITLHTPIPGNSEYIYSIYGRLLYRVRKAGLQNNIRAILYYQGESDGSKAQLHDSLFRVVYNNWNKDFRRFEKLYVVQVRSGCGAPSLQLREVQRQFEFTLGKCQTVSANGLNGHDGCHFKFTNGYELLGQQIANLVGRDFYGSKKVNIDPPNIKNCYYSNADQTEVTINMQNKEDSLFTDPNFHTLFKLEGDPITSITSGTLKDNKVVLTLSNSSCKITGLSYDGLLRVQPWVKNSTQMGLISFYNQPIHSHLVKSLYSGCRKSNITLGEDSISGCNYRWERIATGKKYSSAKINILADTFEKFSLIISYSQTSCKSSDTLTISMAPDHVTIPELGPDKTICKGDSVQFNPLATGFLSFSWSQDTNTVNSWVYSSSRKGKIQLRAFSNFGCTYKDSVNIDVSDPQIKLSADLTICTGTDTLISVPKTFSSYEWNGSSGISSKRLGIGTHILEVQNSFNCRARDTMKIFEFHIAPKLNIHESICEGDFKFINRPAHYASWQINGINQDDSIKLIPPNSIPLTLTDSNACKYSDTIWSKQLALPVFDLPHDTGYCSGSDIILSMPQGMKSYIWNDSTLPSNDVTISTEGKFVAHIFDDNNCTSTDSILIAEYPLPDLKSFHDTILCIGEVWRVLLPTNTTYTFNSTPHKDSFVFKTEEVVNIEAQSDKGCISDKNVNIGYINCDVSLSDLLRSRGLKVYPVPFHESLTIVNESQDSFKAILINSIGQKVIETTISLGMNRLEVETLPKGIYFLKIGGTSLSVLKN
jgi:hypothetical protein